MLDPPQAPKSMAPAAPGCLHEPVDYAVLGQLRVGDPDGDLTPPGQRARDLLAVLLTRRGRIVEPQVLLDLVWGPEAADLTVAVVHTVVARLRRTLGKDAIETTGRGYRIANARVDEDRFVDLVERAQRCRTEAPEQAIDLARQALAIWRSDTAFADISEHLVGAELGRLAKRRDAAIELLAELLLADEGTAEVDEAVRWCEALVAREPMLESAHELLMLGYWRAGRQAEALSVFEELRVLLRDELGVDPSAAIRDLHHRMLSQDPDLDGDHRRRQTQPAPTPPAPTTPLVGRDDAVAQVLDLLDERRLVVITGLGGVGKSRMLSELHRRLGPETVSAFVDLATLDDEADLGDMVESLARALRTPVDRDDLSGSLVTALGRRELLLIIDEAERCTDPLADLVTQLLPSCPGITVLAASRRPLGAVGETVVPLHPLPVPGPDADVGEVAATASVRLLRARISDHAALVSFGDRETLLLGRLARRADGLPLALELLAGYAGTHSLAELDALLDAPTDLAAHDVGRPARHQSLRETIQWSVERLPPDHRRVLRRLGVFAGSFDVAAAIAVAGPDCRDVDRVTRALVREGLIQARREDDLLLFRLPRAVRDFAAAELAVTAELSGARARHRRWHATERWSDELRNSELIADVRQHYPDYLAALRSALEDRDGDTVAAIVFTLGRYWGYDSTVPVGQRWFADVLGSGLADPRGEARIRVMLGNLVVHSDQARALAELDAAVGVLDPDEDSGFLVTAHLLRSLAHFSNGEWEEAVSTAQQAVDVAERADQARHADALGVLALAQATVQPEAAATSAARAWALASASGNPASQASVATNVALALLDLDRADEALVVLRRAAADMEGELPLFLVFNTGWAELATGDRRAALAAFGRVVRACADDPGTRTTAEALAGAACALAGEDHPVTAELAAGAHELATRTGLAMQPFQQAMLDRVRDRHPWITVAWPDTTPRLGRYLSGLLDDRAEGPTDPSPTVTG